MRVLLLGTRSDVKAELAFLLRERGHEVSSCDDAEAALALVETHLPELVILARQDEEALDFCRRLRSSPEGRACVVAAVADGADDTVLHRFGSAGVDDFIVGMDREDLLRVQLAAAERRVRARAERFQAEAELERERGFVSAVLRTPSILFLVLDLDGRILECNRPCEEMTGFALDELHGAYLWDVLLPEKEVAEAQQLFEALRSGGGSRAITHHWVTKSGAVRLITWTHTRWTNVRSGTTSIIATGIDITDQERAESELAKRARQQAIVAELGRQALEGAGLQILMSFAVDATAQALGVDFCEVWEALPETGELLLRTGVGWEEDQLGEVRVGLGADSQAGYTLSAGRSIVVSDLRTEDRFSVCLPLAEHDVVSGVTVVIDTEPAPYGVFGVHTTEPRTFSPQDLDFLQSIANVLAEAIDRRHAENALRESEARVRAILETTVDGIITSDERGIITSFNSAAERIFGYRAEEVIGKNLKVLMPQPYREEHDTYIRNYRETGRRKIIGIGREVTGQRKDGTTFPMDLAVSEVHLKGRRLFTGIIRDITERRRLEQEIIAISEQERRRIGQDLHDGLGQMLTGTGLISQNLARKLKANAMPGADEVSEITELIKEADQFARALARGLVPVDLEANGLASALLRLAANAERLFGITCVFEEIDSPLVYDNTAATHLYRIAQEAVSNAVKHGKAGHVTVRLAAQEDRVRLQVQDDGVGFPDVLGEDRGMGVRIMHYRARIIGGTLEIRRLPEGGTIVTCTLADRSPSRKGRVSNRKRAAS